MMDMIVRHETTGSLPTGLTVAIQHTLVRRKKTVYLRNIQ